ncbi:uncharacterized protein C5orf34 homolog [Aplysia californica]|uniref:Uncharacterized protein C5orf34 homolog n=1 Tax=Aplysia californica TaxID=6500 RepID=A0ABM0JS25_APLCA|nr:uncharacterized protein C5orf34 homolog [Aplysia californica]
MSSPVAVPVLMFLYSNDATEIRYSDGSRLELSPCGSTMVHHKAHSESRLSLKGSKCQKRTRFVTSEHRTKVLQALDFRNRFAERPYLCKELIHKADLISLYATVKEIAWVKLADKTNVDILEDGSRKITSLDEYASLIVSPHCQDFTVCYLSLVSPEEKKSKGSLSQRSTSLTSAVSPRLSPAKSSSEQVHNFKPKEAVVHPYCSKEKSVIEGEKSQHPILVPQSFDASFPTHPPVHEPDPTVASQQAQTTSSLQTETISHSSSQPQQLPIRDVELTGNAHVVLPSSQTSIHGDVPLPFQEPPISAKDHQNFVSRKRQNSKSSFTVGSPSSHEISSISRSSTPDGLRTTIDTDASISHDMVCDNSLTKAPVYKHRHSSPTHHTSSPYEIQVKDLPLVFKETVRTEDISLSGSFLGYQEGSAPAFLCEQQKAPTSSLQQQSAPARDFLSWSQAQSFQQVCDISNLETLNNDKSQSSGSEQDVTLQGSNSFQRSFPQVTQEVSPSPTHITTSGPPQAADSSHFHEPSIVTRASDKNSHPAVCLPNKDAKNWSKEVGFEKSLTDTETSVGAKNYDEDCEDASERRGQYTWRTLHVSRNCCPSEWIHPLKLALEGNVSKGEEIPAHPSLQHFQSTASSVKLNKKNCHITTVPAPISLTCPFQHEHKREPVHEPEEVNGQGSSSVGEFHHGRLKIIISEGIVYRLIHREEMKVIEVHPGDGSILVSQGVQAHFFVHYVLVGDQLEERTYSLKSLPPERRKGSYSVAKLIKTAHRFVIMSIQWDKRGLKEEVPCWKKEVVAVVEPLSSSLLEECQVEGLGKFSAFTSGRVRIVFDDRVALDLQCNFSRRLEECSKHSKDPQPFLVQNTSGLPFSYTSGRLMLPSGQYVTVDIGSPGPYRKYVQAAKEWASWVNASPMERQEFYQKQHLPTVMQRAAELELKKIFCFNYILEQTQLCEQVGQQGTELAEISAHIPASERKNISPRLSAQTPTASLFQPRSKGNEAFMPGYRNSALPLNDSQFRDQKLPHGTQSNFHRQSHGSTHSSKTDEIKQGFLSVRQALLQTSSMISDIDNFLESSKKV